MKKNTGSDNKTKKLRRNGNKTKKAVLIKDITNAERKTKFMLEEEQI